MNPVPAETEKTSAALSSILAACFLTLLKVVVGVFSGSLGILAEAAHSGLDCVAAILTLVAVRFSAKPADQDHPYGHGKVENLSALAETLLLLLTCAWILWEAVKRLTAQPVAVDASLWALGVVVCSIVVDISRSRMLSRIATKYHSQALEADALHFSTDVWSSAVVLAGLLCVRAAAAYPALAFLRRADAVAALVVALIVVVVSVQLGWRAVHALLDGTPTGAIERIQAAVSALEDVADCHAVRLRRSGPDTFVDLHVTLDGNQPLRVAHEITERVEEAVRNVLPGADVTVHPEPKP